MIKTAPITEYKLDVRCGFVLPTLDSAQQDAVLQALHTTVQEAVAAALPPVGSFIPAMVTVHLARADGIRVTRAEHAARLRLWAARANLAVARGYTWDHPYTAEDYLAQATVYETMTDATYYEDVRQQCTDYDGRLLSNLVQEFNTTDPE